jgi:hypothetical protein
MEIPEIILSEALKISNTAAIHSSLSTALQHLELKTQEAILFSKDDVESRNIDEQVRQIVMNSLYVTISDHPPTPISE